MAHIKFPGCECAWQLVCLGPPVVKICPSENIRSPEYKDHCNAEISKKCPNRVNCSYCVESKIGGLKVLYGDQLYLNTPDIDPEGN